MAKKKKGKKAQGSLFGWSQRVKLSPEESLKRMMEFDKRKEAIIAALRKSKDRDVST